MGVEHGSLSIETATIISTSLEGVLYSFSIFMFFCTARTLNKKRQTCSNPKGALLMMIVTALLLLLSTMHIAINFYRLVEGLGFVVNKHNFNDLAKFLTNPAQPSYVAKNSIYVIITLLADSVLIFRCYFLWGSIWVILVPSIFWLITAVCGVGSLYTTTHMLLAVEETEGVFAKQAAGWIHIVFAFTLATNLLATGLLAFRIWYLGKAMRTLGGAYGFIWPTISIILDSGIMYSAMLVPLLVGFFLQETWQIIFFDTIVPVIAIAFYLVILRVELKRQRDLRPTNDHRVVISTPRFLTVASHLIHDTHTATEPDFEAAKSAEIPQSQQPNPDELIHFSAPEHISGT